MGFTLKSTRKLLSRLGSSRQNRNKNRKDGSNEMIRDNSVGKEVIVMMSAPEIHGNKTAGMNGIVVGNNNDTSNDIPSSRPQLTSNRSRRSIMRSASAKRLFNSISSMTGRTSSSAANLQTTRQDRRASIETAKISSLDFHSSRLYHNDSDMEEYSHSSFSESLSVGTGTAGGGGSTLSLACRRRTSKGLYSSSLQPPVRIVEGNSSEEFSSGSIKKGNGINSTATNTTTSPPPPDTATSSRSRSNDNVPSQMDDEQDYQEPPHQTKDGWNLDEGYNETFDPDATERQSNVSDQLEPVIRRISGVSSIVAATEEEEEELLEVQLPVRQQDNDGENSSSSQQFRRRSSKRTSGSSDDFSNLSDVDDDDNIEEEDMYGVYLPTSSRGRRSSTATTSSSIDHINNHLQFIPDDMRADYLLVYEYLQEESLKSSIQDETWRTQIRSARLSRRISSQMEEEEG